MATEVTTSNVAEFLSSDVPVILDFWAEWCGPCRKLAPLLEEISVEAEGRYKVGKVNIDENQELAAEYKVDAIPTCVVVKDGQVVNRIVGLTSKEKYLQALID